jgi:hypothetical protein
MKVLGMDDKKVCFGVGCGDGGGGGAFFIHILSKTLKKITLKSQIPNCENPKISVGWVFRNGHQTPAGYQGGGSESAHSLSGLGSLETKYPSLMH